MSLASKFQPVESNNFWEWNV